MTVKGDGDVSEGTYRRRGLRGTLLSAVVPVALIAGLVFGGLPCYGGLFPTAAPVASAPHPAMATLALSAPTDSLRFGAQESLEADHRRASDTPMGCAAGETGVGRCRTVPTADASALQVTPPTASPSVVDADHSVRFNVTITGGVNPYNVTWLGLPASCPSVNVSTLSCHFGAQPSSPAYYSVSVRVRDSQGTIVNSTSTTVQVNNLPSAGVAPVTSNAGTVPWNITLEALIKGGTPPYVCTWNFGDGSPNVTGNPASHRYTIVGDIRVSVLVNDSFGETYLAHYEVFSATPLTVQVTSTPSAVLAGSNVTLQAQASGGFPPYSYIWSGLPSSCAAQSQPTISCVPRTAGSYVVSVRVQDFDGNNATNSSALLVRPQSSSASYSLLLLYILAAVAAGVAAFAVVRAVRRGRQKRSGASPAPPSRSPGPRSGS